MLCWWESLTVGGWSGHQVFSLRASEWRHWAVTQAAATHMQAHTNTHSYSHNMALRIVHSCTHSVVHVAGCPCADKVVMVVAVPACDFDI